MLVAFAKNVTLVAENDAGNTELTTDPQPMGDANYVTMTFNVKSIPSHSNGTPTIECKGQGSNDGLEFDDIGSFAISAVTAKGMDSVSATVAFAYVRFMITLNPQGAATGDWAAATFDVHGNLVQQ